MSFYFLASFELPTYLQRKQEYML